MAMENIGPIIHRPVAVQGAQPWVLSAQISFNMDMG